MKLIDPKVAPIQCDECQVGKMSRTYITYLTWLGDELITVQNFPAWVCDMCGRREYDLNALNSLSLLLNPNVGKVNNKTRAMNTPPDTDDVRPAQKEFK